MGFAVVGFEEGFEGGCVLFGFFVVGEVTAVLENNELGAGNVVGYGPGDVGGDVEVIAALEDEDGEAELGHLRGEVEFIDGFRDGFASGGGNPNADGCLAEIAVGELGGVEDHAEVGVEVEDGCLAFLVRAGELGDPGFGCGDDVGEGLVEAGVEGGEAGSGGVGEGKGKDVFGVGRGVGAGEQATVGIAEEVDFIDVERRADGFEVGDLSFHGLRRGGIGERGRAGAALVVEDHLAMGGDAGGPKVVLDEVDVGEAGAAIDGDDGGGGWVRCAISVGGQGYVWCGYGGGAGCLGCAEGREE